MPRSTERQRAKDRQKAKKSEAEALDSDEKAFKRTVLALMQGAWQLDPAVIEDRLGSEEGRLACTLTFLLTLTREVMQNRILPEDHPRMRLTHEAYRLLEDVVLDRRTSLDTFFSGAKKLGRPPTPSRNDHINAIIAACINRLEAINPREITRRDMIRWMQGNDGLSEHMKGTEDSINTIYYEQSKKKEPSQYAYYCKMFEAEGHTKSEVVIERAAYCVALRGEPLDMWWATRQELYGVAVRDESGNTTLIPPEVRHGPLLNALPATSPLKATRALPKPASKSARSDAQ